MTKVGVFAEAVRLDLSRWLGIEATRATLGVAAIFGGCIAFGFPDAAILAAIGALYTGLAASSGVHQARIRAMAGSGFMIGLATAVGASLGGNLLGGGIALLLIAFLTALFASSSRSAATIGSQTTALLAIVVGLGLPVHGSVIWQSLGYGGIVVSGSLVQLLLLTVVWPIKPGQVERRAVAEALDALVAFVISLDQNRKSPGPSIPSAAAFQEARAVLSEAEAYGWGAEQENLLAVLRQAEAIRAALVGYAKAAKDYAMTDRTAAVLTRRGERSLARGLKHIAHSVRLREMKTPPSAIAGPEPREGSKDFDLWFEIVSSRIEAASMSLARSTMAGPVKQELPKASASRTSGDLRNLFSLITRLPNVEAVRAVTLQHAIRYAVTVEVAFWVGQELLKSHSYWVPMTVALVLRQGYGVTFYRGFARIVGTLTGLAVGGGVLVLLHPSVVEVQIMAVAVTWIAFASAQASYAATTTSITTFVVLAVSLTGLSTGEITSLRMVASLVGVALALASYVLWPAWNWPQVWETMRLTALAQISYARKLENAAKEGFMVDRAASPSVEGVEAARGAARDLRIQTENLIESARLHPRGRKAPELEFALAKSQLIEENAARIMAAEAEWSSNHLAMEAELDLAIHASEELVEGLLAAPR